MLVGVNISDDNSIDVTKSRTTDSSSHNCSGVSNGGTSGRR